MIHFKDRSMKFTISSQRTSSESMGVRSVLEGSSYLSAVVEDELGTHWKLWALWEEAIVHTDFLKVFERKLHTNSREKNWEWKSESERCIYKQIENLISKKRVEINDYITLMIPENREMAWRYRTITNITRVSMHPIKALIPSEF